jgi:hypothetical protein
MSTRPTMPRYRASWPSLTPSPISRCAGFSVHFSCPPMGCFLHLVFYGVFCTLFALLRIRDKHPGSEFFSIPDPNFFHPGSASKYFNPKKWFPSSRNYDTACSSRIRIPDPYPEFLPIPDPGVKKDPQHCLFVNFLQSAKKNKTRL